MEYATVARTISAEGENFLLIEWGAGSMDVLEPHSTLSPDPGDAILMYGEF